ncbi:MAG: septum formation initiator family protein [Coriobacteriia bacterium]
MAAPVLLVAAVALAVWALFPTVRMGVSERAQRAALQSELDGLQRRNDTLRRQVDRLKTPEGVEQVARTSLGMVRPGERAYIVAGTTASREASPASKDASSSARASWLGALARLVGLGR